MYKYYILLFIFTTTLFRAQTNDSIPSHNKTKKIILGSASIAITAGTLVYLNQAWYQQYSSGSFHTFNDNDEWKSMDKCGHSLSTYQTGRLMMQAMNWAGCTKKNQILIGGLSGFAYMSVIEMMDGYSKGWGFSWGDMAANTLGSSLAISQKILFDKQPLQLKFAFSPSPYAQYRSDLLGKSFSEQLLKDYNGQTYWLSINPTSFIKNETKFPNWLSFAFGYGANGMIGARNNNIVIQDDEGNIKTFKRYPQYYFSLDADLTRIKTKSKLLRAIFCWINIIKIPFPNVELSEGKFKFNAY